VLLLSQQKLRKTSRFNELAALHGNGVLVCDTVQWTYTAALRQRTSETINTD